MKKLHQVGKFALAGTLLLAAVSLAGQTARAGAPKITATRAPQAKPDNDGGPVPDQNLRLKVFRLHHVDPQVLAKLAGKLLLATPVPNNHPGGMPAILPAMPGRAGGPGGFAGAGFAGGGFMGFIGNGPAQPGFFADKRSGTLLVRGFSEGRQIISELVTVLDLPPGKARPKVKGLAAFDLQNTTPETVAEAVNKLGIQVSVAVVPNTRILIARGDDAVVREVREVVEALDVPDKKAGP